MLGDWSTARWKRNANSAILRRTIMVAGTNPVITIQGPTAAPTEAGPALSWCCPARIRTWVSPPVTASVLPLDDRAPTTRRLWTVPLPAKDCGTVPIFATNCSASAVGGSDPPMHDCLRSMEGSLIGHIHGYKKFF
jgi:hypothetical protein